MNIEGLLNAPDIWLFGCWVFHVSPFMWEPATEGLGSKTNMKGKNWDWANIITTVT